MDEPPGLRGGLGCLSRTMLQSIPPRSKGGFFMHLSILVTRNEILVDESDYEKLIKYRWHIHNGKGNTKYARTLVDRKKGVYMHRMILSIDNRKICVDHINGNGLDNRRCNIRTVTNSQNNMNRFKAKNKYKGIHYDKWSGRWQAFIGCNGSMKHLGRYNTAEEAAIAYNKSAKELFGEYANLNIISVNPSVQLSLPTRGEAVRRYAGRRPAAHTEAIMEGAQ